VRRLALGIAFRPRLLYSKSMNKIEDVKPGQTFRCMTVTYKMLRIAGTCEQPIRNQWGRPEGGRYTALRVAVKIDRGARGQQFKYIAFRPGQMVSIVD
jgi:hypothetical protein